MTNRRDARHPETARGPEAAGPGGADQGIGPGSHDRALQLVDLPVLTLLLALIVLAVVSIDGSAPTVLTREPAAASAIAITSATIAFLLAIPLLAISRVTREARPYWAGLSLLALAVGSGTRVLIWGPWREPAHSLFLFRGACSVIAALTLLLGIFPWAENRRTSATMRGILTLLVLATLCLSALFSVWWRSFGSPVASALYALAAVLFAAIAAFLWWHSPSQPRSRTPAVWPAVALTAEAQLGYATHSGAVTGVQMADVAQLLALAGATAALGLVMFDVYAAWQGQRRLLHTLQLLPTSLPVSELAHVCGHISRVLSTTVGAEVQIDLADSGKRTSIAGPGGGADGGPPHGLRAVEPGRITVPLVTRSRSIGSITAAASGSHALTVEDAELLEAVAPFVAIVLERSYLLDEASAAAVIEERSRLAREIHDGLAQHLAFLKMRVQWLKRSAVSVDAEQLTDVEGVLGTALAEARHAISTLRTTTQGASTTDAIATYASEFSQVAHLPVHTVVAETAPEVGPRARVELLRIVQEALNNARKHARATVIEITMRSRGDGLEVTVTDDGVGFAPGEAESGHFGLAIMRERAEAIGGYLDVVSSPRSGTSIRAWAPTGGISGDDPATTLIAG